MKENNVRWQKKHYIFCVIVSWRDESTWWLVFLIVMIWCVASGTFVARHRSEEKWQRMENLDLWIKSSVLPEISIPPSVQIFQTITINKFGRFYYRMRQTIYSQYRLPRSDWMKHLIDEDDATLRISWIRSLQNEKRFPSIYYCMNVLFIEIHMRVSVCVGKSHIRTTAAENNRDWKIILAHAIDVA